MMTITTTAESFKRGTGPVSVFNVVVNLRQCVCVCVCSPEAETELRRAQDWPAVSVSPPAQSDPHPFSPS